MLQPQLQDADRKLGDLPGSSDRDKIEVWTRTADDGSSVLELVEYSWGSGIGWYVQKRVRMDAGQVEALQALLGSAHLAAPRPERERPRVIQSDNVIQLVFPG